MTLILILDLTPTLQSLATVCSFQVSALPAHLLTCMGAITEAGPAQKGAQRSKAAPPQDDTAHGDHVPATALQASAADQAADARSKRGGARGRVQWALDGDNNPVAHHADGTAGIPPMRPTSPSSMHGADDA